MESPSIRGRLVEDELMIDVCPLLVPLVVVVLGAVTPLATTLEEVTIKPPIEVPPVSALEREEVAALAAVEEVELPPVGSALPVMATELFLTEMMVMRSTLSVLRPIALSREAMIRSMLLRTVAGSSVPRVSAKPTFTLF